MAKDIKDKKEVDPEAVEKWKEYVRNEVNSYLDAFLDVALEGTIGVRYAYADAAVYEDGTTEPDTKEAHGVQLLLNFTFEKPLYFTDEEGFVD